MAIKRRDNDYIWSWFDQNLDMETRTIYMGSVGKTYDDGETGVDNFMAEYVIKGMHLLEQKDPEREITILMNNPGGDWYHGMAIYDAISTSSCYITMKVYGHAMSMGSIILQAADRRIMMPNSRFMIHYGYDGKYAHSKIFERWADEGKKVNFEMENIYLDAMMMKVEEMGVDAMNKSITDIINNQRALEINPDVINFNLSSEYKLQRDELRKVLREMLNFDTILTPDEAISLGFADEIFKKE